MKRVCVLLADDHAVFREGLRRLLEVEGDIEVVGDAKDGRQAVELTHKFRPAVVVMDLTMPLLTGLEATRIILNTLPRTKVLILSAHGDDGYVERANELGAAGYLLKQSSLRLLPNAVRDVQRGRMFFCPSKAKRHRVSRRSKVISPAKCPPEIREPIFSTVGARTSRRPRGRGIRN